MIFKANICEICTDVKYDRVEMKGMAPVAAKAIESFDESNGTLNINANTIYRHIPVLMGNMKISALHRSENTGMEALVALISD